MQQPDWDQQTQAVTPFLRISTTSEPTSARFRALTLCGRFPGDEARLKVWCAHLFDNVSQSSTGMPSRSVKRSRTEAVPELRQQCRAFTFFVHFIFIFIFFYPEQNPAALWSSWAVFDARRLGDDGEMAWFVMTVCAVGCTRSKDSVCLMSAARCAETSVPTPESGVMTRA